MPEFWADNYWCHQYRIFWLELQMLISQGTPDMRWPCSQARFIHVHCTFSVWLEKPEVPCRWHVWNNQGPWGTETERFHSSPHQMDGQQQPQNAACLKNDTHTQLVCMHTSTLVFYWKWKIRSSLVLGLKMLITPLKHKLLMKTGLTMKWNRNQMEIEWV